jgi:serine/threonine protein kinase
VKSDVYGFGVVLLEMLSGQRALDPNRPDQLSLVDWAKPLLSDRRRLARLMDPRLEGKYPSKAALAAADLALNCLASEPKNRPSMKQVLEKLEQIGAIKGARTRDIKEAATRDRGHGRVTPNGRSPRNPRHNNTGSGGRVGGTNRR